VQVIVRYSRTRMRRSSQGTARLRRVPPESIARHARRQALVSWPLGSLDFGPKATRLLPSATAPTRRAVPASCNR
jgi:hypothetical protein